MCADHEHSKGHEKLRSTFLKCVPSLTSGTDGKFRSGLTVSIPCFSSYRFDMISSKSAVVFTGKNRLRGTLIPTHNTLGLMSAIPLELHLLFVCLSVSQSPYVQLLTMSFLKVLHGCTRSCFKLYYFHSIAKHLESRLFTPFCEVC